MCKTFSAWEGGRSKSQAKNYKGIVKPATATDRAVNRHGGYIRLAYIETYYGSFVMVLVELRMMSVGDNREGTTKPPPKLKQTERGK